MKQIITTIILMTVSAQSAWALYQPGTVKVLAVSTNVHITEAIGSFKDAKAVIFLFLV